MKNLPESGSVALLVGVDLDPPATLRAAVESLGFEIATAHGGAQALEKLYELAPALVVVDYDAPDILPSHLLKRLCAHNGQIRVIAVAANPDARRAVEAVRSGAADLVDKALAPHELGEAIRAALHSRDGQPPPARPSESTERERQGFFAQYAHVFRRSPQMRAIEQVVVRVADTNATVLIEGETGVGKELVAKAIHYLSDRSSKPWLKVNCASLPAELLESELFGHEKGAFTGAAFRKPGRFELAHGGTLLLDEIGEMPLSLQSKILHVLQDNEFFRVGGRELISVDVRVIAATNKDLRAMVAEGSFREDLYYRLNVVTILVPPLRERVAEIPFLAATYRDRFMQQFNRRPPELSPETTNLMLEYRWPGNIRELENLLKRYVALGDEKHLRDELEMRMRLDSRRRPAMPSLVAVDVPNGLPAVEVPVNGPTGGAGNLKDIGRRAASEAEAAAIRKVLDSVQWNRAEAARRLKISYKTLLAKLRRGGFAAKPRRRRSSEGGARTQERSVENSS